MDAPSPRWLSYRELLRRQSIHALRESDVPVEHAISLGLPTRRWLGPAYAFFASPAVRRPGEPAEQKAPDRWWVLDARTAHLILYALAAVLPFAEGKEWVAVKLPPATLSLEQQRAAHDRLAGSLDHLAPLFFRGEPGPPEERKELADALATMIPEPLAPQYRALVPDFFAWLEA